MRKFLFKITNTKKEVYFLECISDRAASWTKEQYLRHRGGYQMELISDEETEEKTAVSREVELG